MTIVQTTLCGALAAATLAAAGCDVFLDSRRHDDRVYVQEQQPRYVEVEPQYVYVQQAPPPIIVERRPAAPSHNHVWIDGSWHWDSQRYTWQAGRYEVPPQGTVWVAARYDSDAKGYRYTPGQWKKQNHDNGHDHH